MNQVKRCRKASRLTGVCFVPGEGHWTLRMTEEAPESKSGRMAPGEEKKGVQGSQAESWRRKGRKKREMLESGKKAR